MPTLNQGQYIERSIRSVLMQRECAVTLVVVDGGSSDETHSILDKYSDAIDRIVIKPGCSQSQALVLGFESCDAEYCGYLNSDDLLLPGGLVEMAQALCVNRQIVAVYANRAFIDSNDVLIDLWRLPQHIAYLMRRWDYIPQEACLWKTQSMNNAGGIDPKLNFAMDYDLFLAMMREGKFVHLDEYVAAFRVHEHSKTQTLNDSQGKTEVAKLKQRHGIVNWPWDRLMGFGLRHWIGWRSAQAMVKDALTAKLQADINRVVKEY